MPWNTSAIFEQRSGLDFRKETRLFYSEKEQLVGTVIMINPGSSKRLAECGIPATNNPTFRTVISIIEDAYKSKGKKMQPGSYIQVCNLFDICESDLIKALKALIEHEEVFKDGIKSSCYRVSKESPWIWLAWGSDKILKRLNKTTGVFIPEFKNRNIVGVKIANEDYGFYHPGFIQRMSKRKPEIRQEIVNQISFHIL